MTSQPLSKDIGLSEFLRSLWTMILRRDSKLLRLNARRLERRNRTENKPMIAHGGPVVSLTTYGKRINSVYLAIESIAEGSLLPSRAILWLDDEAGFKNRPESLRRLENRGLEIFLTENYGPHKKYYPYVKTTDSFSTPLVTADDDCLYPRNWLHRLAESFNENPSVVSCYRAHVIKLQGKAIAPYGDWTPCRSSQPRFYHFATGCSGCIYAPNLLRVFKAGGEGFRTVCPRNDDFWLHVQALRAGFRVRQIGRRPLAFPIVPDTQDCGLFLSNVGLSHNDHHIKATYGLSDIEKLISELPVAQAPLVTHNRMPAAGLAVPPERI
jgi:hypothetical protein